MTISISYDNASFLKCYCASISFSMDTLEEVVEREDILSLILVRLPVKTLLRFKSVSKFWYSLIASSGFIKMHLIHIHNQNNKPIILLSSSNSKSLYSLTYSVGNTLYDHTKISVAPLLNSSDSNFQIWGSCNGLLLISAGYLCLYNPSTQQYRKLPSYNNEHDREWWRVTPATPSDYMTTYGFGFNRTMDVHKVIRLRAINTIDKRFVSNVQVCSGEGWRTIRRPLPFSWPSQQLCQGLHANGAVHWLVNISSQKQTPCYIIFSFDIENEEYRDVPKPLGIDDEMETPNLRMLKGCLSIQMYNMVEQQQYSRCSIDVWMMMDYGVKESWSKLIRITQTVFSYLPRPRVVCFFNNGEVLMDMPFGKNRKICVYEPKSGKAMPLSRYTPDIPSNSHCVGAYVESLVSL